MDQFDIIVIGGGSAGSAAAGRLAEDGSRTVCLVEAGGRNDNMLVKTPGFMPFIRNASNYKYETVPQKGLNGRSGYQPRGRGLGGSSAINAMLYIRGHAFDYDRWAELGATGWRYADVLLAHRQLPKPAEHLYRELQFALRAAVGTRTLDELLENKTVIDEVVGAHLAAKLPPFGMRLESVGVKDIVLPGEMKAILTQVVQAEKQAQANVIRRREETAATRSLLNTAKVMEDNPVALRMKELETLERVAERIDKISVFGGLDQVLNGLVKMR